MLDQFALSLWKKCVIQKKCLRVVPVSFEKAILPEYNINCRRFTHNCIRFLQGSCKRTDLIVKTVNQWNFQLQPRSQVWLPCSHYNEPIGWKRVTPAVVFTISPFSYKFLEEAPYKMSRFNIIHNMTGSVRGRRTATESGLESLGSQNESSLLSWCEWDNTCLRMIPSQIELSYHKITDNKLRLFFYERPTQNNICSTPVVLVI